MTTAVFITGGIRTYEFCLPYIAKHLVKPLDADVYCYVTRKSPHIHDGPPKPTNKSFDELARELFGSNLKRLVFSEDVETSIDEEIIKHRVSELEPKIHNHVGWVVQWYRLQKGLELCPNLDEYETCIRIRPDIGLLDVVSLPQRPKDNEIFGMYDWFMIMTPKGIRRLADLWNTYGTYEREPDDGSHEQLEWAPETQVYRNFHAGNFRCFPINFRTTLVRQGALSLTAHKPEHWTNIIKNYVGDKGTLSHWL